MVCRLFAGGLAFLISAGLCGQIVQTHRFDPEKIERVRIDARLLSRVEVSESDTGYIELNYRSDGEYQEGTRLLLDPAGGTLNIGCEYTPDFLVPGDKLSAHKVYAVEIVLRIPGGKSLELRAEQCRVDCNGRFRSIDIRTTSGNCFLNVRCPYVYTQTVSGSIYAKVSEASITAESAFGELRLGDIPESSDFYRLSSIRGNVVVEPLN